MAANEARMVGNVNFYVILVGNSEINTRTLWDHKITVDFREIGLGVMSWMNLAYNWEP